MPAGPILGEPASGTRFYSLVQADDAASTTRRVSCEVRALCGEQLTSALDGALRAVTTHAALADAVLETRVVRLVNPTTPIAALVQELARQLWAVNLPVSFGPSWTPIAPGAHVAVGTRGLQGAFEAFLRAHPAWQRAPGPGNVA